MPDGQRSIRHDRSRGVCMDVSLRGQRHVLTRQATDSNRSLDCSRVNVVGTPQTETGLAREVTPEYDPLLSNSRAMVVCLHRHSPAPAAVDNVGS